MNLLNYINKINMIGGNKNDEKEFKKYCPNYDYFPSILPQVERIIVIGDIHGDYDSMIDCLKVAKVINNNGDWIGGKTHIVQVGDQIDRCRPNEYKCDHPKATKNDEASDIKIMKYFTELNSKAIKSGGKVISLLGNHELMNVNGNMNYVSLEGLKEFDYYIDPYNPALKFPTGEKARKHAFARGNEYGNFLGCTRLASVIIGDCIFVHAGIIKDTLDKLNIKNKKGLYDINKSVRLWLLNKVNSKNIDKIVGSFKTSMFWTRVLGSIPPALNNDDPRCEKYLEPALKLLKVNNMFIGHTPQFYTNKEGMNGTCNDKLWRVDTGHSGAFDEFDLNLVNNGYKLNARKIQVLEILHNNGTKTFNVLES